MKIRKSGSRVLGYECAGFGLLLGLSWLNELGNLPHWFFGDQIHVADWRDCALESVMILFVWWVVYALTRRLVAHLHYLEGLLRVCAWCRKVGHNGEWMRLEEYFVRGFQIETTHGMCPECMKKMEEDTAEFYRKQTDSSDKSTEATEALQFTLPKP
jgi:hypothetical protein